MRFLNILSSEMLEKRLQRDANRSSLSALLGQIHVQIELHGDEMPEAKRENLNSVATLGDEIIETSIDLESTVVALFDSANIHAAEVKNLRLENARLKSENQRLGAQLKFERE